VIVYVDEEGYASHYMAEYGIPYQIEASPDPAEETLSEPAAKDTPGDAGENDSAAQGARWDTRYMWLYIPEGGGATITGYGPKYRDEYTYYPKHLVIPGDVEGYVVTGIGSKVIGGDIASLAIPDSVKSIDDFAFQGCHPIPEVTIPAGVIRIGLNPFLFCTLKNIFVSPGNPVYADVKGVLFDREQSMLIAYPNARKGGYTVPKGTQRIGGYAFATCIYLTAVKIPNSVTEIGEKAFNSCLSLTKVTIPDSITHIDDYAFYWCNSVKNLRIPESVIHIGYGAFQ